MKAKSLLKLRGFIPALQFCFLSAGIFFLTSCSPEEEISRASVILKSGSAYTAPGEEVSPGGKINIGILASGSGSPLTYLRIERITGNDTTIQLDRGIYVGKEGFDADFSFRKGQAASEVWRVLVMNADRDTATASIMVRKGAGTNYGPIHHYADVVLGMQQNFTIASYLDADLGLVYDDVSVAGIEGTIDIVPYFYFTSGLPSPSLTCPGYTSVVGYYPSINTWFAKNSTLFDYNTSDNDLISTSAFDAAVNDSLLVTGYNPTKVSGNCKYAYSGKVIPFKTQQGKYGLLKIVLADEHAEGTMLLEIKIQQ